MLLSARSNFSELPEDILLEICYFLNIEDVFSLRGVSEFSTGVFSVSDLVLGKPPHA